MNKCRWCGVECEGEWCDKPRCAEYGQKQKETEEWWAENEFPCPRCGKHMALPPASVCQWCEYELWDSETERKV